MSRPDAAAELAARRVLAAAILADFNKMRSSTSPDLPPSREWMLRLSTALGSLLDALPVGQQPPAPAADDAPTGPYETEREARDTPAVRAVWAAFDAAPGAGKMIAPNLAMLTSACEAAGVTLGEYDRRILAWLAGWEPTTCVVVAGLITRAAAGRDGAR